MTSDRDAAPAATARTDADRDRTDKAALRPGEGTGNIMTRLRQTRADMIGTDDEGHYWDCHDAAGEIERLRKAIRRLAGQDATLSVCDGAVTVTMDATLTDAEREAIARGADALDGKKDLSAGAGAADALAVFYLKQLLARTVSDTSEKPVAQPQTLLQVERELLEGYLQWCEQKATQTGCVSGQHLAACARDAATLRGLLERLG